MPNQDPSLLLLSQETKTIALLRLASKQSTNDTAAVVGSLVVPDEEANQPEGVAWDHVRRRLWVAGEPNELLLWAEDCTAYPRFAGRCDGSPSSPPSSSSSSSSAAAFVAIVVAGAAGCFAYAKRDALAEKWRDVVGGGRSGGLGRGRFIELSDDV